MGALDAIFLSLLYYGKKSVILFIVGVALVAISIAGIIYFGSLVITDVTKGNIGGASSLPNTSIGPFSVYHIEYGFVFLLIFGAGLALWGYFGRKKKLSNR
jgi:ABC-type sulfate transport system permease subunit